MRDTAEQRSSHNIPARLYDMTLERILKWLTIMADKEGVGLNRLQFTTSMSISLGFNPEQHSLSCEDWARVTDWFSG